MLFVEDLNVRNMSRSAAGTLDEPGKNVRAKAGLNKAILDQGWSAFRRQLEYKSQWRGGTVVAVPPQHTSQTCSVCGYVHPDNRLSRDRFHCRACGHADINAAKNIRARGHRVLACGGNGVAQPSSAPVPDHADASAIPGGRKQEPVGNREGVPPTASQEAIGIPVL